MTPQSNNPSEVSFPVDADETPRTPESKMDLSTTRDAAKHYAQQHGWAVFPCVRMEKKPATPNGCLDATTEVAEIDRMFRPDHNLGVATGQLSGVFALDIDGEVGEASLAALELERGELPQTVTAATPRNGRHFYFRFPTGQDIRNSESKIGKKLDIRGEGGYVIAPPSRRQSGRYSWVEGCSPDQIDVADAPGWLIDLVLSDKQKSTAPLDDGQVPEGERNGTLASAAGSLRRAGLGQDAMEAALLVHNRVVCNPPLPESEVKKIAESIAKYDFEASTPRIPTYRPFPTDALPETMRRFVDAAATSIGCDASFLALPLLAGAASAIGNTRAIELKRGWIEPSILWTVIVGDSGTTKSPALDAALRPVKHRQNEAWKLQDFALAQYDADKLVYEKQLTAWKKNPSAVDPPAEPCSPVMERTWVDDITIEALASTLQQQPRGLLVACDELASWLGGFDRYNNSSGGDAPRWLEMYGARSMVVDRKTGDRRTIVVPRATVSVTGGIQPGVLRRALTPQHRESGLAARLLLACPPRRTKTWTEDEIDPALDAELSGVFARLYALKGAKEDSLEVEPVVIALSPAAKGIFVKFFAEHAEEQVGETGDLSAAWSKLEGCTARLALVLHVVENGGEGDVTAKAMRRAVRLIEWFKHETRRVYALLAETDDQRKVRELVERIQKKGGKITPRDLQRDSRQWPTADAAERDLEELKGRGLGKWGVILPTGKGGRPARVFCLKDHDGDVDGTSLPAEE